MARGTGYGGYLMGSMLLAVAFLFMGPVRSPAEWLAAGQGFGELKWGDTAEQAMQAYPDLRLEGYRLVREKEVPFQAYVRERASIKVDGVRLDSLEYWFRGNRFLEVHGMLQSRIGPRTLVTEAERSYDALEKRIRKTYGVPGEQTVKYVTEQLAVVKETKWATRGVIIRLKYNGADKGDVDRLTLEMGRKGGAP